MRTPRSPWPYVVFTALAFSTGALVSKALVDEGVDAVLLTGVPFVIAGVIGVAIAWSGEGIPRPAVVPAAALGVANTMMPAVFINLGFETLPAGLVTLLIASSPVVTAVTAHLLLADERLQPLKIVGLTLSIIGVAVLALGSGGDEQTARWGGVALVLVGVAAAGISAVPARVLAVRHGAATIFGVQLLAGGVVALAAVPVAGRAVAVEGGWSIWFLVGLGVLSFTALAGFRSMMAANEVGTTGQVSVIGYLLPVFGVIGGAIFFDEAVTVSVLGGGALILGGVIVLGLASRGRAVVAAHV